MNRNGLALLAAVASTVLAAIAGGCITKTPTVVSSPIPRFAYVAEQNDNNVSGFAIDNSSGNLSAAAGSPFTGVNGPRNAAVCPSGQLLYVANGGNEAAPGNGVSGYQIDLATGALTAAPGSPFAGGNAPRGVTVDPTGNFVYVANSNDNTVSAYKINSANGALTPVSGSPFPTGTAPFGVAVDPTGRFLYVTNHHSSDISAYTINPMTGALTPISGSPFEDLEEEEEETGPFEIAIAPSGTTLYVTNHFTDNVVGFSINTSTGALTEFSGAPFPAGDEPFGIVIAPSGQFVYVANRASANVYAYSVSPTNGALTQLQSSPYSVQTEEEECGASPYELALDGTGRFLYVPNNGCGNISAFSVDAVSGALTPLAGSPFTAGNGPYGVAISRLRLE